MVLNLCADGMTPLVKGCLCLHADVCTCVCMSVCMCTRVDVGFFLENFFLEGGGGNTE